MAFVDAEMTTSGTAAIALTPERIRDTSITSAGEITATAEATKLLIVTITSAGEMSSAMVPARLISAEMVSEAALGSAIAAQSILNAVMVSLGISGSVLAIPDADSEVWVCSLGGGSSSYSNYAFNSFAKIGDAYYGAGPGGIYELAGDDDDGAPVRAGLSFGKRDFGSSSKKTVSEAYFGMSSSGNLFVKLIAEGEEYIYRTEDNSPEMQQQRIKFGKGLQANYLTLEIYNEDGADFELDTVEFMVADLSRKT